MRKFFDNPWKAAFVVLAISYGAWWGYWKINWYQGAIYNLLVGQQSIVKYLNDGIQSGKLPKPDGGK